MNKDTIILADNSYTIRRIVELSFAEDEDVELISIENGLNIKEKLTEVNPKIVLVDIKLPELNGYEVCKFINETESLKSTKVFLMKGGFEPVDENLLKDLKYIDIITKPFDSNALVTTIKQTLGEDPKKTPSAEVEEIPSSIPEDIPEIADITESDEDISFSDIKDEIGEEKSDSDEKEQPPKEDIQPSEEKTQGAQYEKEDALTFENIEEIENPFKDEQAIAGEGDDKLTEEELKMKKNIVEQEQELDISSLTQEEIRIKKIIEEKEKPVEGELSTEEESEAIKGDTDERFKDTLSDEAEEQESEKKDEEIKMEIPEEKPLETPSKEKITEPISFAEPEEPEKIDDPLQSVPKKEEKKEISLDITKEPETAPVEKPEPIKDEKVSLELEDVSKKKEAAPEIKIEKEDIIHKVEDTLTVAVKEILWEVVPPLAEKIIKEEIKKIKADIDSTTE